MPRPLIESDYGVPSRSHFGLQMRTLPGNYTKIVWSPLDKSWTICRQLAIILTAAQRAYGNTAFNRQQGTHRDKWRRVYSWFGCRNIGRRDSGSLSSGKQHVQTGIAQTLMSDRQGRYRAPELRVDYEVRVSNAGFDTVVYKGKALAVGVQSAVDFSLAVGQQTQTVVVQAQVSQVETTNDAIGTPTSRQQMPGTKERGYA